MLCTARWKCKTQKIAIWAPIAQICWAISWQLRHISTIGKKTLLNTNVSATCPHNMVNFGLLAAETCWRVWGIPANFNGLRVLAVLLHGTLVVGVIQALRRSTEGATYIWQGGHHVWHWPTFLVIITINSGSFCRTRLPQCSWQTKSSTSTM